MQVLRFDANNLKPAYDILCQSMFPDKTLQDAKPPFGMTYCEIEPGGKTAPHDHYDGETFVILDGRGEMSIAGVSREVAKGDVVVIPNHSRHELKNLSSGERLKFVSLYWNQPAALASDVTSGDTLVYSAPPTPNGKLHVGHLSGPYLAADVARKYVNLRGGRATYACGADENQTYVPAKARQLGRPSEPLKVAQEYTEQILGILASFGATPDVFLKPHRDAEYREYVQQFFARLVEKGALERKEALYPYCEECAAFVHESTVHGGCPHCGEKTNGNGCEACGLYNDSRDLKNPVCNVHARACVMKPSARYVFPLAKYRDGLKAAVASKSFEPRMRRYVDRVLAEGLAEITVSYPYPWGIETPGTTREVIYEWLEMAAAYLYEAKKASPGGDYEHYWVRPEGRTVLAFGFDNSFFYMALVPALLTAFDERIRYPDAFLTNYFYLLDGKKFSTSRNHAVWGDEILAKAKPDLLRLYLAGTRAEKQETNFTRAEFESFVLDRGAKAWDALLARIAMLTTAPRPADEAIGVRERRKLEAWDLMIREAELALQPEHFSLNEHAAVIERFRASLEALVDECEKLGVVRRRMIVTGLKGIVQLLLPVCPDYGARIGTAVGHNGRWSTQLDLASGELNAAALPVAYFEKGLTP